MGASPERIDGRYLVERVLGEGAAARVLRCLDTELDRPVALKLLVGQGAVASPERFADEARVLGGFSHPNIVQVYRHGFHQGIPYLVLELVEGGTLHSLVERGPLDEVEVRALAGKTLEALAFAHSQGVLHRDVKPENVLLTPEREPKLTDFGLAKGRTSEVRTMTGIIMGTPEFLAPEIYQGEAASSASDVYAWGCLLYYLVNGRPPHQGNFGEIARASLSGVRRRGREVGRVRVAVDRALVADPKRRGDARELLALLRGETPTEELPRGGVDTAVSTRPGGVRSWTPLALAGFALGLSVGLLGWLGQGPGGSVAPAPVRAEAAPEEEPLVGAASRLVPIWRDRAAELAVESRIRELHGWVLPATAATRTRRKAMRRARDGARGAHDLAPLRAEAARLPFRDELEQDLGILREVLPASSVPLLERLDLARSLQPFAILDAYYEAWGERPPYGVASTIQRLFPQRLLPAEPQDREGDAAAGPEVVDPGHPLGLGRHLLFRWIREVDRSYPWLAPSVGEPNSTEFFGVLAVTAAEGNFRVEDHLEISAAFGLPEEPRQVFGAARVRFLAGNLFAGEMVQVHVNGVTIDHLADPRVWTGDDWDFEVFPERVIEVGFPVGLLIAGQNRVRVTCRPLPGLRRLTGFEVDHVELELDPPGPDGGGP